jgi:hypothetical protein
LACAARFRGSAGSQPAAKTSPRLKAHLQRRQRRRLPASRQLQRCHLGRRVRQPPLQLGLRAAGYRGARGSSGEAAAVPLGYTNSREGRRRRRPAVQGPGRRPATPKKRAPRTPPRPAPTRGTAPPPARPTRLGGQGSGFVCVSGGRVAAGASAAR